ncbi:DUF4166 domain-containing protein [Eleftheria terrae]|uniref:DUF4166 domain-containing protein n=1 Tax=Eleftheria terrae TaxID=1597781 RepID=UPI00263B0907|nr:DUF4166 domain-containing protein [Eleftheria terrae]WKB55238.1 DUF4166 domain-containing protein [Eleftheria terrae]
MYESVMGEAYGRLAPAVQDFHRLAGRLALRGEVVVQAPAGWLARLLAWALRAPLRASAGPIRFALDARPALEVWTRHFPLSTMSSCLQLRGRRLVERLGAAELVFELREREGRLEMVLQGLRFLGIPCPRWLMPEVRAVESGAGRRLHFDVGAWVPGCGQVARYQGHLDLDSCEWERQG